MIIYQVILHDESGMCLGPTEKTIGYFKNKNKAELCCKKYEDNPYVRMELIEIEVDCE
jgi:hypothetical protein